MCVCCVHACIYVGVCMHVCVCEHTCVFVLCVFVLCVFVLCVFVLCVFVLCVFVLRVCALCDMFVYMSVALVVMCSYCVTTHQTVGFYHAQCANTVQNQQEFQSMATVNMNHTILIKQR